MSRAPLPIPFVVAALALAACAGAPSVTEPTKPVASRPPASRASAAVPPEAASPRPEPSTTGAAAPAVALQPLARAHTRVTGTIVIDALYALSEGHGALVDARGTKLTSDQGGSIISNNGGALVSNNGSGVAVSFGSGLRPVGYGILANDADIRVGSQLPAAGMIVRAIDLATGQDLPVGVGPDGEETKSTTSDITGAFTAYVPTGTTNYRVSAAPPAAPDARFTYGVVRAPQDAAAAAIDEDTALATLYLTVAYASRLERLFLESREAGFGSILGPAIETLPAAIKAGKRLDEAARAGHSETWDAPTRRRHAERAADALLAFVDLGALNVKEGPVIQVLGGLMREARERTTAKLRADPAFFRDRPFLSELNALRAGEPPITINRPSDVMGAYGLALARLRDLETVQASLHQVYDLLELRPEFGPTFDSTFDQVALATTAPLLAEDGLALEAAVASLIAP